MSLTPVPEIDRRQRLALAFLALALLCLPMPLMSYHGDVKIADWPREVSGFPAFRDFVNLWTGGHAVLSGAFEDLFIQSRHVAEIERLLGVTHQALAWSYPPTIMLPLAPFALLPFGLAAALWTALGVGVFLAALGVRDARPETLTVVTAAALAPGMFLCVTYGQTALLTAGILFFGLSHAKLRPVLAGAILALLVCKPQIGLIVPFALIGLGAWRAFASTAAFSAAYILATLVLAGPEPWILFWDVTLPQQTALFSASYVDRTMLYAPAFVLRDLGFTAESALLGQGLISLAVAGVLPIALKRMQGFDTQFLLIALAALLISPYMQSYELPLLTLAAARLVHRPPALTSLSRLNLALVLCVSTVGAFLALAFFIKWGVNVLALLIAFTFVAAAAAGVLRPLGEMRHRAVPV